MNYVFDYIMIPMQLIIVFFTLYYFVIAIFGMWRRKEDKILTPKKSFAIIVAAHNEENVISQLVENLHVLKYPRELYDIYVVADNCKDNTAQLARNAGAIVYERFNLNQRGKGYAMEWMFAKLFRLKRKYDAVVVFDADNLVHPDFLLEMNNRLCKGEKLIQGYLNAKNPHDTWIAGTFAISFWVVNHIWHLAKYNLGLSSVLGGTGMCISTDILQKFGWGATCLTEDMEFTMKVLLIGIRTTWAHDAIVYDEKPLTFKQSWKQRKRWAQGHFDIAGRYIPKMLAEGFKRRDIRILDGVLHLLQPHFLILSTTFVLLSYVYHITPFYTNILYSVLPIEVWTIIAIGQYVFPLIVLAKIRAQWKSWFYVIFYPLFVYSWIPITFLGFIHRHDREWSHTEHTRGLSYHDVLVPESNQFPKENFIGKQAIK
ncbi:MAG: glycosyltransferase family 2 protein [Veillonellaceae bacterium]|jgi:cellulose synthase/poly-beta-1,6-N-acetylglucosamine synthase-like glycosyltransferase|nr:glycosyltransferase family 2 protein [Veillonellaceae bacterium]